MTGKHGNLIITFVLLEEDLFIFERIRLLLTKVWVIDRNCIRGQGIARGLCLKCDYNVYIIHQFFSEMKLDKKFRSF